MKTKYKKYSIIKAQAENDLEKEEIEKKIYKELPLPKNPQTTLDDFIPKDTQYWHKYNQAKSNEKRMFYLLLHELLKIVEEPIQENGRPAIPLRDLLFCSCLKIYNNFSGRRIMGDLQHAKDMNFITRVPSYNSLLLFMQNEFTSEMIQRLITISAMPLSFIESDFSLDSTGFGSYQYDRWVRVRFQKNPDGKSSKRGWRNYVKLHISVGTNTQTISAADVTKGNMSDTKQLPYLVGQTSNNFKAKRYMADKAYSSRFNMQLINSLDATPYIPFKINATGTAKGSPIWSAMFTYFSMYRKQFDNIYHKRSLVESTFSVLKRKYGEFLKSKKFESQKNEVLLKCLCHNISCLIEQIYQKKIQVNFNVCNQGFKEKK